MPTTIQHVIIENNVQFSGLVFSERGYQELPQYHNVPSKKS